MKNINITREEAINTIIDRIWWGSFVPMVSLGNGGAGFGWIDKNVSAAAFKAKFDDTDNYNFRVVPLSDIADDFIGNVCLVDYYVCVEFSYKYGDNPYRAQFLLWLD